MKACLILNLKEDNADCLFLILLPPLMQVSSADNEVYPK